MRSVTVNWAGNNIGSLDAAMRGALVNFIGVSGGSGSVILLAENTVSEADLTTAFNTVSASALAQSQAIDDAIATRVAWENTSKNEVTSTGSDAFETVTPSQIKAWLDANITDAKVRRALWVLFRLVFKLRIKIE